MIAKLGTPALYALVAKLLRAVCDETKSHLGLVMRIFLPPHVLVRVTVSVKPTIRQTSFMYSLNFWFEISRGVPLYFSNIAFAIGVRE